MINGYPIHLISAITFALVGIAGFVALWLEKRQNRTHDGQKRRPRD